MNYCSIKLFSDICYFLKIFFWMRQNDKRNEIFLSFQSIELQNDRANHSSEIESLRRQFEKSIRDAEDRHRQTIEQLQERDQAWQTEKQVKIQICLFFSIVFHFQKSYFIDQLSLVGSGFELKTFGSRQNMV